MVDNLRELFLKLASDNFPFLVLSAIFALLALWKVEDPSRKPPQRWFFSDQNSPCKSLLTDFTISYIIPRMTEIDEGQPAYTSFQLSDGRRYSNYFFDEGTVEVHRPVKPQEYQHSDNIEENWAEAWHRAHDAKVTNLLSDSAVAVNFFRNFPGESEIDNEFLLAGITHPDKAVRSIASTIRPLSEVGLALAIGLNDDNPLDKMIIICRQRSLGVTEDQITKAEALAKQLGQDMSLSLDEIFRGKFQS